MLILKTTNQQPTRQTDGQTDGQTDAGQSDPYVSLYFAGDTKMTSGVILSSNSPSVINK